MLTEKSSLKSFRIFRVQKDVDYIYRYPLKELNREEDRYYLRWKASGVNTAGTPDIYTKQRSGLNQAEPIHCIEIHICELHEGHHLIFQSSYRAQKMGQGKSGMSIQTVPSSCRALYTGSGASTYGARASCAVT